MKTKLKDNEAKGNTINFGLINNTMQANTEINNDLNIKNEIELKTGPISLIKAMWGNKVIDYIANYKEKQIDYLKNLQLKTQEEIPNKNLENPRISIVGPVLDNLKYNLDEEHIKEMFSNLLVSEMDNRKQNNVLPAYIYIIKQLSKEDAILIKQLYNRHSNNFSLIEIIMKLKNDSPYVTLRSYITFKLFDDELVEYTRPNQTSLDNLERLQIIKITREITRQADTELNKKAFEKIIISDKNELEETFDCGDYSRDDFIFDYNENLIEITEFGYRFMKICCS